MKEASDAVRSYVEIRREWAKPMPAKLAQQLLVVMEDLWWEFTPEEIDISAALLASED